ncbi:MAG: division/cell wall cluster transcriptional repressor MraZ [Sorangiineae bacterium]|nr:division/cell wall cluster transcriptional repressor MraZ [Polyangiaceae bacterium]MEB2322750.1 division/cell wall cluster transcriptional repressor MraZ [Sorangiineae bacterium]
MFRGQFTHAIDAKGRVSLPARFREAVAPAGDARLIVTPAPFDPCLHVYPMRAWEDFEVKISELPRLDPNIVRFRRLYVSAAVECEIDRAGRVLVPPQLRERAGLTRDVLWAGMGGNIELWAKEQWDSALALTPDEHAAFQRAVMEQIRI